jgi:serine/threonine-protein kinase
MGDRELDARSDVYSLGAMLYEMLTGEPPYTGPTAQSIVAKVITEKAPPVTAGRPTTPPHVAASIDKSLQKLPADRFHTAAEFSEALARPGMVTAPRAAVPDAAWKRGLLIGRATAGPEPADGQVVRFTIPIGPEEQLSGAPTQTIALSRDGSMLGYIVAGGGNLFVRHMELLEPTRIDGVQSADNPFFSPNGEWIAFDKATGELGKAPVAGGPPLRVTLGSNNGGITWTDDGYIVFRGIRPGLMSAPASGGDATPFVLPDTAAGELDLMFPDVLPGGAVLVTFDARGLATPRLGGTGVAVVWPETGERKVIIPSGAGGARYSRTEPVVLAQNVHIAGSVPQFSISDNGTLAYVPARVAEMVLVSREGHVTPASDATRQFHSPRISPDGRRVVVDISDLGSRDVWVQDLEQGTLTRVSFEGDAAERAECSAATPMVRGRPTRST